MENTKVRVRFAPSPTGPLHIGGVRTALYNYLFARKNGGKMILRIEDTDQNRFVKGAEEYILESLSWCGIELDEGIKEGGLYAPYRQSDRKAIYRDYALQLFASGNAYYAFDTQEELEAMRKRLETEKALNTSYSPFSRMTMKNSLTMSKQELELKLNLDESYVIRFKTPENEDIKFSDLIRGEISVKSATLDDKVLFKSDGMPTYHLANVVDDRLMKISHVIRGEEWLPSLALHIMLYRAFGWGNEMPEFAHLPLILKPDGKGKLSKRDGDRMGFPVFPMEWRNPDNGEISSGYRESGYFPEAFVNILAFLGWNPGTEQELFSLDEMIHSFSLERVGKSGARFDPEKAKWFNHQYLMKKKDSELADNFKLFLSEKGIQDSDERIIKIIGLVRERSHFVKDFWDQSWFFYERPGSYDPQMMKKIWKENTPEILNSFVKKLQKQVEFEVVQLDSLIKQFIEEHKFGMGQIMTPLRLALVGAAMGPGVTLIMNILGKDEVLTRINLILKSITNK
jgi:glutamyl-tRNA synthetase